MTAPKARILIVEDERDIVRLLRYNLEKEGYSLACARDAEAGLKLFAKNPADLVLLDVMLPKVSGLEFLRSIRQRSQVPVVLLTAKRSETDRILGLKLGADDYIVKPFSVGELIARVEAILRRAAAFSRDGSDGKVIIGGIAIDFERHEIRARGRRLRLAPKEFAILKLLIEAKGKVLSRQLLLEKIWGHGNDVEIDTRTVDQHIARLRRKLKREGEKIATVTNFGYQIKMG